MSFAAAGSILALFTHLAMLSITGLGVIVQGIVNKSHISEKVKECKFAYQSYEKVLIQLRSYLRGVSYDEKILL